MDTITYRPARDELAYTFGGRVPVGARPLRRRAARCTREDCFGGARARTVRDLPSQVCRMPYLNPVTGPFFVEDAEPGDTLAVHFARIVPARDWGVSATFPHFGALTSTSHTGDPAAAPAGAGVACTTSTAPPARSASTPPTATTRSTCRWIRCIGTVGVAPGGVRGRSTHRPRRPRREPRHPGTAGRHHPVPRGERARRDAGPRRRPRPPGRGRGVRRRRGDRHAHHPRPSRSSKACRRRGRAWRPTTPIMSVGCARPLEDAYRIAHARPRRLGRRPDRPGRTSTPTNSCRRRARAPIGNVCDPNYTILAAVDKAAASAAAARLRRGARPAAATHRRARGRGHDPMTASIPQLPLRDELFLLGHDDDTGQPAHPPPGPRPRPGRRGPDRPVPRRADHPRPQRRPPGRGRGGSGCTCDRPVGDLIADTALAAIRYAHPTPPLQGWLRGFADDLYDRTRAGLVAGGILRHDARRRLGGLARADTLPAHRHQRAGRRPRPAALPRRRP